MMTHDLERASGLQF